MTPDVVAGAALVAAGVAGLGAGLVVTVAALWRTAHAQGPCFRRSDASYGDADLTVADGIDDLARVARAAGVWAEDEVDPVEWREPYA